MQREERSSEDLETRQCQQRAVQSQGAHEGRQDQRLKQLAFEGALPCEEHWGGCTLLHSSLPVRQLSDYMEPLCVNHV